MENEMTRENETTIKQKGRNRIKDIIEIIVIFVVMFLIFQYILMSVRVSGPSMEPTYVNGERGIMLRTNMFNKPTYGNVVVIDGANSYGENEGFVVKRVFAMGGDTFEIKDNKVYVNDKEVADPHREANTIMEDYEKITIQEGYVFILGDNRNVSEDSRYVGPVKETDIKAVHGFMYWPIDKIGIMK